MKLAALALALLTASPALPVLAQTTEREWQQKAVERYPELKVEGSELNRLFVEAVAAKRRTNPAFFSSPQWPLLLANQLAASRNNNPPSAATALSEKPAVSFGMLLFVGVLVLFVIWVALWKAARAVTRMRINAEAKKYLQAVDANKSLPKVHAPVMLKSGEDAFYSAPAVLYETRNIRHYESGSAGIRIAKGVYIGRTLGRSVSSQEWSKIDVGMLTVTNKRLIFDGRGSDRTVQLGKIISADPMLDTIEISTEGKQKSMVFTAPNPLILAAIIRICHEADDPLSLPSESISRLC